MFLTIIDVVKLQSSLTVQSKSVGLGVDFDFPPSQQLTTPTKIYQKEMYYRLEIWQLDLTHNTSLAAQGALAHRLQRRTACNTSPPA